jgi:transcription initiation factor TFIIIB Brf1 subunit/transcription initiation factor TFIIB
MNPTTNREAFELLPCPFCGSANITDAHQNFLECHDCGCYGPDSFFRGSLEAGWNTRTQQQADSSDAAKDAVMEAALQWRAVYRNEALFSEVIHSTRLRLAAALDDYLAAKETP